MQTGTGIYTTQAWYFNLVNTGPDTGRKWYRFKNNQYGDDKVLDNTVKMADAQGIPKEYWWTFERRRKRY